MKEEKTRRNEDGVMEREEQRLRSIGSIDFDIINGKI